MFFSARHLRASGEHSEGKRRLFGRDPNKSSTFFQNISREETEKQTARRCRAWEFSRSRAQETSSAKGKMQPFKMAMTEELPSRR